MGPTVRENDSHDAALRRLRAEVRQYMHSYQTTVGQMEASMLYHKLALAESLTQLIDAARERYRLETGTEAPRAHTNAVCECIAPTVTR